MKKTFGVLGTGLLLVSNVLMSFGNVSFAINAGDDYYTEENGCYVYKHYYQGIKSSSYLGSVLSSYKCDTEGGVVDLRDAPLESGQYIVSIGENAFSGTNVIKVIMPSTVEYIGDGAFCGVRKEGVPVCGNGIIEEGEDCDSGNIFIRGVNATSVCNSECREVPAPVCGNGIREQYENCFNCRSDVEADGGNCTKSIKSFDNDESLESELLLKASLPVGEYDDSDFVVVDFPDGINNDGFDIEDLNYACAKLQEYVVTFKTEDDIDLGTGETFYKRINPNDIPQAPEKEGLIGVWYLGNEIFDFNSQVTDDITLVYKYEKGGIDYDIENGWIKVSLGDQEIIVKDRNQWAEKTFNEVESDDDFGADGNYYFWGNNTGLDLKQITDPDDIENLPEGFDHGYVGLEGGNDWTVGSNDTPCNPASGEYLPSPDDWKNLMQLRGKINGYEVVSAGMGYFFNDFTMNQGGGGKSLNVFISAGPTSSYNSESMTQFDNGYLSAIEKFSNDLYILLLPPLSLDNGGINFLNGLEFLPSALNGGKIGYFVPDGLILSNISNLFGFENSVASPVRCFVKPQFEVSFDVNGGSSVELQKVFSGDNAIEVETQKENVEFLGWYRVDGTKFDFSTPIISDIVLYAKWQEKKTNSSSGGGGRSSANKSENEDNTHNSAESKKDSSVEETIKKDSQDKVVDNNDKGTDGKISQTSQKVKYVPDRTLSENEQAYDFSRSYGITTKNSVENAKMNSPLTRIQMAKMLSNYAMNVLGRQPDLSKGTLKFNDVTNKVDKEYDNGVTLAYQLGIMGQNMPNNMFRPYDEVTRAEFVAAFSRMMYGISDGEYKSTSKYYVRHMEKLKKEGIITKDNPSMKEKRGYVMIMLMRSVK